MVRNLVSTLVQLAATDGQAVSSFFARLPTEEGEYAGSRGGARPEGPGAVNSPSSNSNVAITTGGTRDLAACPTAAPMRPGKGLGGEGLTSPEASLLRLVLSRNRDATGRHPAPAVGLCFIGVGYDEVAPPID